MAKLIREEMGQEVPLSAKVNIGRAQDNTIVIDDRAVSAYHAEIEQIDSHFVIRDLQSTNKTFVNGAAITEHELKENDTIRIGLNHFRFESGDVNQINMQKTAKLHKSWIPGVYYTKDK